MTLNLRTSLFASGLMVLASATQPASASSIVTEWLDQTIPAAKQTAWEPTIGARFFALVHAAMYDAWTAYDPLPSAPLLARRCVGLVDRPLLSISAKP